MRSIIKENVKNVGCGQAAAKGILPTINLIYIQWTVKLAKI